MIKVLYTVNGLRVNGMSSVIMQYMTGLQAEDYQFVLFTDEVADQYLDIINNCGAKLITSEKRRKNQVSYFLELCSVIKQEKIDIVHSHGNSATLAIEMLAAALCGVKVRVAHSHNTSCIYKKADKILRPLFNMTYTHGVGCGIEAGKWLFGEKEHQVIKNGIDLCRFAYNYDNRISIRRSLDINDETCVVGHVGRFTDQKNHAAILRIFKQFHQENKNAILLLVGDGPKYQEIKKLADELGILDFVCFYGTTANTEQMYSTMDLFLFPSKFEGVPLTLIEAQANGLPCFISETISSEVIQTNLVSVLELGKETEWAKRLSFDISKRKEDSEAAIHRLIESGFECYKVVEQVDKLYRNALLQRR